MVLIWPAIVFISNLVDEINRRSQTELVFLCVPKQQCDLLKYNTACDYFNHHYEYANLAQLEVTR